MTRRAQTPGSAQSAETRAIIATRDTLSLYLDDPAYQLRERHIAGAFARGDVCVAIFAEGRLAGYGWVAYKPVPHQGRIWVDFAPGQHYTTNSFTRPDFRGRHLRGSKGALNALDRKHGATHSLSATHTHNFASLRADARNGARVVGLAGYVEMLGRVVAFRSAGERRVGFRFRCPDVRWNRWAYAPASTATQAWDAMMSAFRLNPELNQRLSAREVLAKTDVH